MYLKCLGAKANNSGRFFAPPRPQTRPFLHYDACGRPVAARDITLHIINIATTSDSVSKYNVRARHLVRFLSELTLPYTYSRSALLDPQGLP